MRKVNKKVAKIKTNTNYNIFFSARNRTTYFKNIFCNQEIFLYNLEQKAFTIVK